MTTTPNTPVTRTYAQVLRSAMIDLRLTRRDLERRTQYSYEHIRKVVAGHPVASEACNRALCRVLQLDEREMWRLGVQEKLAGRFGYVPAAVAAQDSRMTQTLARLTSVERARLLRIADGWLATREADSSAISSERSHQSPEARME